MMTFPTAAILLAAAMMAPAIPQPMAMDTPVSFGNIEVACSGVGSAKDDPRWAAYPVKIVPATSGGANLANAHITLTKGRQEVAGLDCDAPWILFKAPPGAYTVTATLIGGSGRSSSANFGTTGSGRQKEVTIRFASGNPAVSLPAGAVPPPAGQ